MRVEIDQSGKVEDTSKPTILAFTNGVCSSIKISAKTKRRLQEVFRRQGKPKLFIYTVFSIGLYILLKDYLDKIDIVTVDQEYVGHEVLIRDLFLDLVREYNIKEPTVHFVRIGNKPKVHYAAHDVFTKKLQPTKTISFAEIITFLPKKNDRGRKGLKNA